MGDAIERYPPGDYIGNAMKQLPAPGPDVAPQTLEIDAGALWGRYRVTFVAKRNPRQGMRSWFWTMHTGERME